MMDMDEIYTVSKIMVPIQWAIKEKATSWESDRGSDARVPIRGRQ